MTLAEILKLGEMGYTKDEINRLEQGNITHDETAKPEAAEPEKKEAAEEKPKEVSKPESAQPSEEKKPVAAPDETAKRLDSLEQNINKLIKAIQDDNRKRDSYGAAEPDFDKQVDKAMAALIRPDERKE